MGAEVKVIAEDWDGRPSVVTRRKTEAGERSENLQENFTSAWNALFPNLPIDGLFNGEVDYGAFLEKLKETMITDLQGLENIISLLRKNKTALGDVIDVEKLNAILRILSAKKQVLKTRVKTGEAMAVRLRGKTFASVK